MAVIQLSVPRMSCRHGVRVVTARLRDLPGVEVVQADLATATLVVHGAVAEEQVRAALDAAGFPAVPGQGLNP
jgi:copper chaperone CopZ